MPDVITIGETMVSFITHHKGPLRYADDFKKVLAGSESNVAIGLTRLGHSVGWISSLGNDEFGKFIFKELTGEGIDTSRVKFDSESPTGIMFKELKSSNVTNVYYYRKGSAASKMSPEFLDENYLKSAKVIHLTGITPALSKSCLETFNFIIDFAINNNISVSLDPNIRLKLWSKKEIKDVLLPAIAKSDIFLCGEDEGEILFNTSDPTEIIKESFLAGAKRVVVKLGSKGAYVSDCINSDNIEFIDPLNVEVVDSIGAGDAFASGYLSGYLRNLSNKECGQIGAIMGAYAVTTFGDYEGLPTKSEIDSFLNKKHISR